MKLRRLLAAPILSAGVLTACAGGGTVLSTGPGASQHVLISAGGTLGIARVLAGSSVALSAVLVAGAQNAVVPQNRFVWSASVMNGGQYVAGSAGQTKPCGSVASTTSGATTPYTPDYSVYLTIDPTNEANVILSPPAAVPAPAGSTVVVTYPYCVDVTAKAGSAAGSIVVAVVDPQDPLQ